MGRPSLKKARFNEILDAFEICVAQYGLTGATLEQVADQAGLARPLIRHHVGNRDDLVNALVKRYLINSDQYLQQLVADLPESGRLTAFIDRLFSAQFHDRNFVLLTEALVAAAANHSGLAAKIKNSIDAVIDVIESEVKAEFKTIKLKQSKMIATGILGIYFNVDSLSLLGDIEEIRANSKLAVLQLLAGISV